jgi:hypothetical protein
MLMTFGGEVKGQTKTYLTGQKTGSYVLNGSLVSLGPGNASLSTPMLTEAWGCGFLGAQTNEFRFYYGDQAILTGLTTNSTTLKASRSFGLLGALGAGADVYFQIRNTSNTSIPAGTPTYFKLKERPTNTGISLNVGGLLGMTELNSITGIGYSSASNYTLNTATTNLTCSNTYNGAENPGSIAGTQAGTTTKLLIDELGEWYAKVTPNAAYNSVRLNVAFPSGLSLANVTAEIKTNVYNAFTQTDGNICNARPQFTNAGEASGINLNTGVLGLDLNQLVANPHYAINGNPTQYSSFSSGVLNLGVASTISQTFYFDHSGTTNDGVSFKMGLPQALIDLALFGNGITFKVYKDETLVNTQTLATNILDLNLLNLISLGAGYKELNVTINPNVVFNKVVVELNAGLLNLGVVSDELRLYDVTLTSSKPTFTSPANSQNVTICSGNTATLSATTDTGNELIWYNSLSSTTPLLKNSDGTYTSPALTSNTTYYVASRKIGCTFESERIPVNVTINPLPTATISGTTSVCQNATATSIIFTGSGGTAPYTFTYNINGGTPQTTSTVTGNSVTITAPTGSVGPFAYNLVSVKDGSSTQCSSNITGQAATVTVNPLPVATILGTTSVCQNATAPTITFTGSGGTAPYTFTYNINGGTPQTIPTITGNSVTITAPTGTVGPFVYNLVSVKDNSSTQCSSSISGQAATVTVNPLPSATISGTTSVCLNATAPSITFTGNGGSAPYTFTYSINGGATQTIPTVTGNSVTITAPTGTAGPFVYNLISVKDNSATQCSNSVIGQTATVTVNPLPTVSAIIGNANICVGVGYTFTNTSADPGAWTSDNAAVATVDNTGFVKGISVGTANITYTITNTITHCSNSTYFTVNVSALPTISLGNIPAICEGSTTTSLPYTSVSSSNLKYDIIWNTTSLTNVSGVDLPASPIQLSIPANAPSGAYTGTFSIRNTTSNCTKSYPINLTINQLPSITLGIAPTACQGITNAPLTYSSPIGTPISYSIVWAGTAITAGFLNVTDATLPFTPITLIVPTTLSVTTYGGTISVKNANGCISSPIPFNITIHPKPPSPTVSIQ